MDSVAGALGSALSEWREGSDDHFYGAWRGGSKASGGRPMTKSEAAAPNKDDRGPEQETKARLDKAIEERERFVQEHYGGDPWAHSRPGADPALRERYRAVTDAQNKAYWDHQQAVKDGMVRRSVASETPERPGEPEAAKAARRRLHDVRAQNPSADAEWDFSPASAALRVSGGPMKPDSGVVRRVASRGYGSPVLEAAYAGSDGKPAGYLLVNEGRGGSQFIGMVGVDKAYRGKGVSIAMYDWLQDHGGVDLYSLVGASQNFTPAGKAFALKWLNHRIKVEQERAGIREAASGDDHFYGAWRGGKASSGGRPMTPSERAEAADWGRGKTVTPEEAYGALLKGESPNIRPSDVGAFMDRAMVGDQHPDLSRLQVAGTLSFGGKGLGLRRNQMPQLSHRNGAYDAYVERVRSRGIKVTNESVDPRTLQPTQNEISALNAAKVLRDIRVNEQPRARLTVSQEGYVLDGHHRWGAAVAHAFEKPGYRLNITRIGMPARDLLKDALAFNREKGIRPQEIHEAYAAVDEAWSRMEQRVALREASDDDHFYGPWFGGSRAEGGRPGRGPTLEARRADMAQKVGAENVGNVGNLPGRSVSPPKQETPKQEALHEAPELSSPDAFYAAGNMNGRDKMAVNAARFDALPDDAPVWVFHATSYGETADSMLGGGIRSSELPQNLARQRFAAGEQAEFAPGAGTGQGTYVGGHYPAVEGYGRHVIAMRVRKGDLVKPPEANGSLGEALADGTVGLMVRDVKPNVMVRIPDTRRIQYDTYETLMNAFRAAGLREADDDHFYGAWKGGSKSSGGRPMTPSEQAAPNKGEQSPKERFKELSRTPLSKVQPEPMTSEEAERRLKEALPFTELRGIERLSPEARAEVVPTIEALRAKYPDAWPSRIEVRPRDKDDGRKTLASVTSYSNVLALHDEFMGTAERRMKDEVAFSEGMGWFVGTNGGALRPHQAMVVHEWGHVIEASRAGYQGGFGGGVRVTSGSRYSHQDTAERWAEAFLKYHAGGSEQAALVDRTLDSTSRLQRAQENLSRWGKVRDEQWGIREAGDDDHFYGPWFGGSRAAGGRPGRGPSAEARRADMAKKVGAENVGVPPQERGAAGVGKAHGDAPDIKVAVVDRPQGHGAIASYGDNGTIQLGKDTIAALDEHGDRALYWGSLDKSGRYHPMDASLPAGHKGIEGKSGEFAHEVGHAFESQFDIANPTASGLGRFDSERGVFVAPLPAFNGQAHREGTWKNASEAAADAFAHYVQSPDQMHPASRSWVEARLAEKPGFRALVERLREHPDPRHWVKQGGIREAGDSASDDMRSAMAAWREADDDDHFYGAWKGGSKASGGRPMTKAEQAEAKTSPKADPKATTAASEQARMERLAREPLSSVKAEPMNTHEAQVRLKRVFPEAELVGIEHLSPEARAEMVPMFEALAAKYPDVKPSRLRIAPRVSGSAAATTSHRGELSFHDEFMKGTADQWVRMNESTGWLIGTGGGKLTPYGSIVVHEWGHLLALRRTGKTSGLTAFVQKHTSTYGRRTPAEKWAEAFAAYHAGKHPTPGRVETALEHRGEAVKTAQQQRAAARRAAGGRDNRTWYQRFTEADDDDHFYGAWRGGSKASGGGPGRAPTLDERRRDMARRVGAENVGVLPKERARRRDALRAAEEASPVGVPESAGRLTEAEAVKRLSAAMPNTRIEGLQWMHPQIRGEVVPMFEALAKAFPTHHPTLISVGGANSGNYLTRTAFREGAMGVTSGGVQITLNRKHFEDPARFQKMFDRCEKEAWFAQGTGMTPAQYVVTHEWGHQVNRQMNVAHRPDMLTPTSMYARKNYEERWAEAFTSWVARGVNDNPTRYVGDVLARRWPGQYGHLRDEGMLPSRLAEADDEDHFYGAWQGGAKASGGRPGRAPTQEQRRADMVRRVGAANVGTPPRQELKDAQERVAGTQTPLMKGRITTMSDSPDAADLKRWDDSMRNMLYRLRQQRGRGTTSHHTEKPGECSWVKTWPDGNVTAVYHHPETGKPVAGVRIEQLYAGPAIAVVEVHPGYRGQGIATKMYDWLTDHGPVDMVQAVGRSDSFTHQGKAFATAWLQHRIEVERARASVREADTEDHFYGAWKGGKASAGGHPMTHAERREAKANEALRRPMPKSPETRPEMLAQLARDAQDALNAPKPRRVMPEGPMSVQEAERRLSEAMPRTRLEDIDRMSPAVRGEVVPTFEMLAASFPDAHPRAIVVGSTKNNFVTSQTKPGVHATTDMSDAVIVLHERSFSGGGANRARTLLSYSEQGNWLVGGYSGSVTQHQGVVMHEWGHVVDARLFSGMGQRSIPHGFPSLYGRMDPTEGFAEAFVLHAVGATGYSSVADLRSAVTSERARRLSGWTQLRDREKTS